MQSFVGTSGYSYKEWKGSFYPDKLPASLMLGYYAERLNTVEINSTFYRMPTEKLLLQWSGKVPNGFTFVIKASRRITHLKRLRDVEDETSYLLRTAAVLEDKLGPMLFQFPPSMKMDMQQLQAFLELLPVPWQAAMEFRHDSWFDDRVFEALRARNVAWVTADTDDDTVPLVSTADWGYLRLRREDYDSGELADWARRVREQGWQAVYVFFKHEDEANAPRFAAEFKELLNSEG